MIRPQTTAEVALPSAGVASAVAAMDRPTIEALDSTVIDAAVAEMPSMLTRVPACVVNFSPACQAWRGL
ncbi:hypothetical protein ASG71_05890 [Arthrobacter sp. Soil763]|nr:hypothetical protein ASG71_05890 [Arthrobacter sp. Soil763]